MDTVELTRDAVPPLFAFTDEHQALREVVRALFADTEDPAIGWRRLLGEIGADEIILGSADSTESGASAIDLAILAEEAGAALFGGPLVPAVLAGQFAAGAGDPGLVAPLRDGTQTVGATVCGAGPVWHGVGAHRLLVQRDGGLALFDTTDPAVSIDPVDGLDLSRPLARYTVGDATPIARIDGEAGTGRAVSLTLSAELLGVAQFALDGTVAYVAQRVQFGRTIGSFQAVKHRLVDLLAKVELTRSAVYGAAWQLTVDPETVSTEVDLAVAAALSRDTALAVTKAAIQLHGGIAITYEHWAHRYFRRAHAVTALTGPAGRYRRRLADLVDLRDGVHV